MTRRRLLESLSVAVCGLAVSSGCETLRHGNTRNNNTDDDKEEVLPKEARDQHKSTSLPGALSSQGSDIERDLGVR